MRMESWLLRQPKPGRTPIPRWNRISSSCTRKSYRSRRVSSASSKRSLGSIYTDMKISSRTRSQSIAMTFQCGTRRHYKITSTNCTTSLESSRKTTHWCRPLTTCSKPSRIGAAYAKPSLWISLRRRLTLLQMLSERSTFNTTSKSTKESESRLRRAKLRLSSSAGSSGSPTTKQREHPDTAHAIKNQMNSSSTMWICVP